MNICKKYLSINFVLFCIQFLQASNSEFTALRPTLNVNQSNDHKNILLSAYPEEFIAMYTQLTSQPVTMQDYSRLRVTVELLERINFQDHEPVNHESTRNIPTGGMANILDPSLSNHLRELDLRTVEDRVTLLQTSVTGNSSSQTFPEAIGLHDPQGWNPNAVG